MSIKRIYLTRRNPAIKAEDFPREWRRHAALAASFSNVNRRYTRVAQCTKIKGLPGLAGNDFAGVALLWMESLEVALQVNEDRDIIERLRPDEVRVFGTEVVNCSMFAQERVVQDGEPTGIVVIEFLKRAPGTTPQAFADRWQNVHAARLLSRHLRQSRRALRPGKRTERGFRQSAGEGTSDGDRDAAPAAQCDAALSLPDQVFRNFNSIPAAPTCTG